MCGLSGWRCAAVTCLLLSPLSAVRPRLSVCRRVTSDVQRAGVCDAWCQRMVIGVVWSCVVTLISVGVLLADGAIEAVRVW